jgi:hypothetical protein
MMRAARNVVGIVLVALGLLALLTPLTPGSWLIPIGLELLGLRLLLAGKLLAWANARPGSWLDTFIRKVLRVKDRSPKSPDADRSEQEQA